MYLVNFLYYAFYLKNKTNTIFTMGGERAGKVLD
jgi:hypothetical protein